MELDPITLEVISNRLREIGLTMEYLLFHSGYSTILRESQDGSAGVCDREGRVSIASGGVLNIYPHYFTIQAILQSYPLDKMREGDSFVLTDPYLGGPMHVPGSKRQGNTPRRMAETDYSILVCGMGRVREGLMFKGATSYQTSWNGQARRAGYSLT